jgi:hypothetical protein
MCRGWDDQRIDDLICSMIEPGPSGVTISDNAFSRFETDTKAMTVVHQSRDELRQNVHSCLDLSPIVIGRH